MIRKILQSEIGILGGGYQGWFKRGSNRDTRLETRENVVVVVVVRIVYLKVIIPVFTIKWPPFSIKNCLPATDCQRDRRM
jgi:hypothetical protein